MFSYTYSSQHVQKIRIYVVNAAHAREELYGQIKVNLLSC